MIKSRVFISCGQRGSAENPSTELGVAAIVKRLLEGLGYEVYIAVEQHSLNGFTENILSILEKSEYYLFIDFRREEIVIENEKQQNKIMQKYRGSLFSHQELGIATYLRKEHTLIFQERSVLERDGIKGFVQANSITFRSRKELPATIIETIHKECWQTGWRNELLMERVADEYEDTFYQPLTSDVRFFHIRVTNNHHLKTAHECLVYLTSIIDLSNGSIRHPPLVEFKWKPVKTKSVAILPNQYRYFDAFFVERHIPNVVYLGINPFLLDFTGVYPPYLINGSGDYDLEYVLVSREFRILTTRFRLRIGPNLDDLSLVEIQ